MPLELPAAMLRSILSYDPGSGLCRWRWRSDRAQNWNSRFAGKIAGAPCGSQGRWQITINDTRYLRARVAWALHYGEWPTQDIDHRDTDNANDRIDNLRLATDAQNLANRAAQSNNTSGFKGVNFDKQTGRWRAKIKAGGKFYDLGRHPTAETAAEAYAAAARRLHGEFARTE